VFADSLGDAWATLAPVVQRLHAPGATVHAGVFRVGWGKRRLARILAWLGWLPPAGEAVSVQLVVSPTSHGEEWRRSFAGRPFVSTMSRRPDGRLTERLGMTEFELSLTVVNGALFYEIGRAALRLGPLRIPLPRWLWPRATAWKSRRPMGSKSTFRWRFSFRLSGG
jgi:hypothetical protein